MAVASACKFLPEQIVRIVKKVEISGGNNWCRQMDRYIGNEGRVLEVLKDSSAGCWVARVRPFDCDAFWYSEDALEPVEFPEDFGYYTTEEVKGIYEPAGPDHVLTKNDRINFGTAKFDLLQDCQGHTGKAVKDVVCKSVEAFKAVESVHVLHSRVKLEGGDGFWLYTPKDKFAGGTEVQDLRSGLWSFANLDGEPVPAYPPGARRPKYRKPRVETILYKTWIPSGPGDIRPEGLQYRRKEYDGLWKTTKVAGKPVEQGDIDAFDYRVPK